MMSVTDIVQTSGWKNFMAKLYGWGASVVIVGALFKINHWPGGSLIITIGLVTEAIIFFFSAFEPLHEELDWTLVYPELAGMADPDEIENFKEHTLLSGGRSVERIEDVLDNSGVDSDALTKLGAGFDRLNKTAHSLSDLSQATVATDEFVSNLQGAATAVTTLNETYQATSETVKESTGKLANAYFQTAEHIAKSGEEVAESYKTVAQTIQSGQSSIVNGSKEYETQLNKLSQNLGALNSVYEHQIKESNAQMKGTEEVYSGIKDMISNLRDSVDETNKYKEEMSKLKESISSLNSVYSNMLTTVSNITGKKQ